MRVSLGLRLKTCLCTSLPLCAVRLIHIKALKYSLTQYNSRKRIGMQCHGPLHLHRYSLKHSLKTPFRPQIHKATFRTLAYLDPHRIEASVTCLSLQYNTTSLSQSLVQCNSSSFFSGSRNFIRLFMVLRLFCMIVI